MIAPAVRLKSITKKFRYYSDRNSSIKQNLIKLCRGQSIRGRYIETAVIDDLSLTINKGEFVGVMGRNGAGKSTLLKILSGIYQPTSGEIEVDGRIAPLIEVGAGFSPDLSGYENIYLNASILGFSKHKTSTIIDSVIDFAELRDHIDKPVKNYSSGMVVRLGFAIAIHLDAPILLVDEVFAVGDLGFQMKCAAKVKEMHEQGRTIILITHDLSAVLHNCDRAVILDNRKIIFDGAPSEGIEVYRHLFDKKE